MGGEARYLDTTDRPALQVVDYDDPSMYYIHLCGLEISALSQQMEHVGVLRGGHSQLTFFLSFFLGWRSPTQSLD